MWRGKVGRHLEQWKDSARTPRETKERAGIQRKSGRQNKRNSKTIQVEAQGLRPCDSICLSRNMAEPVFVCLSICLSIFPSIVWYLTGLPDRLTIWFAFGNLYHADYCITLRWGIKRTVRSSSSYGRTSKRVFGGRELRIGTAAPRRGAHTNQAASEMPREWLYDRSSIQSSTPKLNGRTRGRENLGKRDRIKQLSVWVIRQLTLGRFSIHRRGPEVTLSEI